MPELDGDLFEQGYPMVDEKRRFPRLPIPMEIAIIGPDGRTQVAKTSDMGHGGLLLALDDNSLAPGTEITLRIAGELGNGIEPPVVKARVVRVSAEGVGVQFIDTGIAPPDESLFD